MSFSCQAVKLFSSVNCEAGDGDNDDEAVNCDLDFQERRFSVVSQFHLSWFHDSFDKRNDDCADEANTLD